MSNTKDLDLPTQDHISTEPNNGRRNSQISRLALAESHHPTPPLSRISSSLTLIRAPNMRSKDQQQHEPVNELCTFLLTALKSSLIPISFTATDSAGTAIQSGLRRVLSVSGRLPPISPSGMASLMLGISLSLMFCGSVTFFIGFMMMPWVLSMAMLLYFLGIVYSIFGMCKDALISHVSFPLR